MVVLKSALAQHITSVSEVFNRREEECQRSDDRAERGSILSDPFHSGEGSDTAQQLSLSRPELMTGRRGEAQNTPTAGVTEDADAWSWTTLSGYAMLLLFLDAWFFPRSTLAGKTNKN